MTSVCSSSSQDAYLSTSKKHQVQCGPQEYYLSGCLSVVANTLKKLLYLLITDWERFGRKGFSIVATLLADFSFVAVCRLTMPGFCEQRSHRVVSL